MWNTFLNGFFFVLCALVALRSWKCLQRAWNRWLWSSEGNPPSLSSKTVTWRTPWGERSWPTSWHRDRWDGRIVYADDPACTLWALTGSNLSLRRKGLLQRDQSLCAKRDPAPVLGRGGEEDEGHPRGWPSAGGHPNGSVDQQTATGESVGICQPGQEAGVFLTVESSDERKL